MKKLILLNILLFWLQVSYAQEVHKIKNTKTHNINAVNISLLELSLKSANITVTNWDRNEIEIIEENEASNMNKMTAEKEMTMIKCNLGYADNMKEQFLLSNQIIVPDQKTFPTSRLITTLSIKMPRRVKIQINQNIGRLILDNIANEISLTGNLTQTTITKSIISGQIKQNFGSLTINNSTLTTKLDLSNVVFKFETNKGRTDIKCSKCKSTFILNEEKMDMTGSISNSELDILINDISSQNLFISGSGNRWQITPGLEKYFNSSKFLCPKSSKSQKLNVYNSIIKILNF